MFCGPFRSNSNGRSIVPEIGHGRNDDAKFDGETVGMEGDDVLEVELDPRNLLRDSAESGVCQGYIRDVAECVPKPSNARLNRFHFVFERENTFVAVSAAEFGDAQERRHTGVTAGTAGALLKIER